ncbi:putative GEM-like protein 8 isoform X2 [Bidens hawaiensis]|uniref:putative GEM-like protein 8 isoform X2 n=1 Tax=Bidens hawaiensis TaxID=980011 RepID=UPI00404982D4
MDNRLSNIVMSIPIISTRGLLSSKPYNQPHYPLSTSKINGIQGKHSFAALIKNYGPKLIETVKHKLSYGARILPLSRAENIFRKKFSTIDSEELLHSSQCYIYTTAGAIAGILFISTERVGFCSNKSLKMHSTLGEVFKYQYKVSIPLRKIKGVGESMNLKKPSNKYVELVTVDDYNFWFLGFPDYKKTLRHLHKIFSIVC